MPLVGTAHYPLKDLVSPDAIKSIVASGVAVDGCHSPIKTLDLDRLLPPSFPFLSPISLPYIPHRSLAKLLPTSSSSAGGAIGTPASSSKKPSSSAKKMDQVETSLKESTRDLSFCPLSSPLDHSSPNPPPITPPISVELVKLSAAGAISTTPLHLPPLRLRVPIPRQQPSPSCAHPSPSSFPPVEPLQPTLPPQAPPP